MFKPSWNSLKEYHTPKWFQDAKFGIYTHWGPYSVHACGPNTTWYAYHMYHEGTFHNKYHTKNFGHPSKFGYKDFIPMFKAEKFDPDQWAELFRKAGAQFAGPVGEHHDAFTMWDTKLSEWNSVNMGPKRDVVGELEKSIRKQGMRYMVALHHAENWWFFPHWLKGYDISDPRYAGLYGESHNPELADLPEKEWYVEGKCESVWHMQDKPSKAFLDKWLGKTLEVIDNYKPDMLWFDFGLEFIQEHYKREFLSHYYNKGREWGKEVVVSYKYHNLAVGSGVVDLELGRFNDLTHNEWLTDTTVDDGSAWGYMKDAAYKTPTELIHYLVDNVSKNGYMLLNVGPMANGLIPDEAQKVLLDIGKWLEVNGEAIYGTTPWICFGEGPTRMKKAGAFTEDEKLKYTSEDFRFTVKDDAIYATCFDWPKEEAVIKTAAKELYDSEIESIVMLGTDRKLPWKMTREGLRIGLPDKKPCESAYVFKINRKHPFK